MFAMSYPQQPWGTPQGWPPQPPPKPPQSNTNIALAALGAILGTCFLCVAFGRSGNNSGAPTNPPSSFRPVPPRPEVVARARAAAAQTVREARAGVAVARAHLEARRLDEAVAAITAVEARLGSVAAMQPPVDGLADAQAELTPVATEVRARLVARNAPRNALAHVADTQPGDILAYDATLEADLNAMRGIPAAFRVENEAQLRAATQAVERRRRAIREQVQNQVTATEAAQSRWRYDRSVDDMRGTATLTACITASSRLTFQFPYQGGSSAELCLRQTGRTFDAFISVSRGQFICHVSDCPIALKVDEGAVIEVGGNPPDSAAHDIVFLRRGSTVRQSLVRARRFIVEATFYREGARQIVFEGAQGLVWPPPTRP
jgi:hypothetical protein